MFWQWGVATALAGVWVHDNGEGYGQLTYAYQRSARMFLPDGRLVEQTDEALLGHIAPLLSAGRYAAHDVTMYTEIGLGRGFEAMASLPMRHVENRFTLARGAYPPIRHANLGLGDLSVGGRYGTGGGPTVASTYANVRIPLYDNRPEALGIEAGNSDFEDDRVPLGQGTVDLDVGGSVGTGGSAGWALAEAGIRVRSQGYSTAVPVRTQLGIQPLDRWSAWAGADLTMALGDGSAPDAFRDPWGKGPIVIDNQSALNLSVGTAVQLVGGLGLTAEARRTVWGVRFPELTTIAAGVSWRSGS